ncbi:MAG: hypothetical protein VB064_08250 [Oscillospiraceae bacterium]|nr:hypothetical protein [Oscillospiraceae bacterium]
MPVKGSITLYSTYVACRIFLQLITVAKSATILATTVISHTAPMPYNGYIPKEVITTGIKDPQSRKWQLTINNSKNKGLDHDAIKAILASMKSLVYWCMADEIGLEQQTPHSHVFITANSGIRFSTLKNRFPEAHIEQARGSCEENKSYVEKSGKWADDEKADTSIPGTFEEFGELPDEPGPGFRSDIAQVYTMITEGKSNAEIIAENPDLAIHIGRMDKIRTDFLEAQYRDTFRELTVTYIFGPTETGKTRTVMEKYGYSCVYRVTDYDHPFDRYNSEPVICFDEFRSSLRIQDMLMYLEGYPLNLPARYAQRVACYTEVYLISNIDLREQYRNIQEYEPATWRAFLRRINKVVEFIPDKPPVDRGTALEYLYPKVPDWVTEAENAEEYDQDELPF